MYLLNTFSINEGNKALCTAPVHSLGTRSPPRTLTPSSFPPQRPSLSYEATPSLPSALSLQCLPLLPLPSQICSHPRHQRPSLPNPVDISGLLSLDSLDTGFPLFPESPCLNFQDAVHTWASLGICYLSLCQALLPLRLVLVFPRVVSHSDLFMPHTPSLREPIYTQKFNCHSCTNDS